MSDESKWILTAVTVWSLIGFGVWSISTSPTKAHAAKVEPGPISGRLTIGPSSIVNVLPMQGGAGKIYVVEVPGVVSVSTCLVSETTTGSTAIGCVPDTTFPAPTTWHPENDIPRI